MLAELTRSRISKSCPAPSPRSKLRSTPGFRDVPASSRHGSEQNPLRVAAGIPAATRRGFCSLPCRLEAGTSLNPGVDLNFDLGEGAGHDLEILDLVSSANIACGFHAGDPASIFASIQ